MAGALLRVRRCLTIAAPLMVVVGCQEPAKEVATAPATAASPSVVNHILADYNEAYLRLNPRSATRRGDHRFNDRFVDPLTDEYLAESRAMTEAFLARMTAVDPVTLAGQERLSHEIFSYQLGLRLEGFARGFALAQSFLPFNQFNSLANNILLDGSGEGIQPFNDTADYDNWLQRAAGFSGWVDSAIGRMRQGVEAGVVHPRVVMEKALPQLAAAIVEDPRDSMFYAPIRNFPPGVPEADRERLAAAYLDLIENQLIPAYAHLHAFVRDEYLPQTRDTVGRMHVANGVKWYRYLARYYTTTDLTPEQIHEVGLEEVERITAEMERVRRQVGFAGALEDFLVHLRTEPSFYYDDPADVMAEYARLKARIQPRLPDLFETLPRADYVLREIETFRAPTKSAAQYRRGSGDGSRPGVFYVNTHDLKSRPKWRMPMLSLHEAEPGHHLQISLAQELEGLPEYRRHSRFTAFSEGWALYTESLGKDLGVYDDPYAYFGSLVADVWRANRLVVDTGMHAMGWTREQAIAFMSETMPFTDHAIVVEVERYIAYAGQALAYKIGQLKILELRRRAEAALGERFDIRQFHSQVLMSGALPMRVLEAKIDRWIAVQL